MSEPSYIRVLGAADARPTKGLDHSCYTVNDELLIDACPSAEMQLLNRDIDPNSIRHIFFTHFHADHYLGLPAFLFYRRFFLKNDLSDLTIYGPEETIQEAIKYCLLIASESKFSVLKPPKIVPLHGGEVLSVEHYKVATEPSDHTTPGLMYRIMDTATGHTVGFTGDTAYMDSLIPFFQDADLLVHEMSFGASIFNENSCRHSSAEEAVKVCARAHVKHLLLTHAYAPRREDALNHARELTELPVDLAVPGTCVEF